MTKVLVVDDYQGIGEFLADVCTAQGWQVTTASDGREALSILNQEAGWLILLDLSMPEMDGVGVLRALQATPLLAQSNAAVLMTARTLSHEQQEALTSLGAKAILCKPFDLDWLLQVVDTWAPASQPR